MPSLVFDVSALDRASQAFERIANKVDMLIARLAALNASSANPRLDVDTDPADRTLGRWAMDFRRKVREAIAEIPTVDITVRTDLTDVERDMARIRQELASILDKEIGVDIEPAEAIAEIERLKRELNQLDREGADIQVRTDIAAAMAALEAVLAEARRVDQSDPTVDVKVDQKGLRDVINAMALFNRSITQIARGPGLVVAIPGLVSLLDSLTDLLGLLGLLPGLAFAAVAGVAALGVAFEGVGEALGAMDDPEKFAEALKKLSPAAAQVVQDFAQLRDEFGQLRAATQQAFFEPLVGQVQRLATVIPTLQGGLQGVAGEVGNIAAAWADWAFSMPATIQLGQIFENIRAAAQNLAPGIVAIAQALTDMALVGARMLPQLATGFSDAMQTFQQWIAEITANGQFEAWIRGAYEVVVQLADIVTNTWTGFQGLFDAANASGQTFLTTIQGWAQAFTDFTNSMDGQAILIELFDAMKQMGAGIGPAIGGAFQAIGAAIVAMAPAVESVGQFFGVFMDSVANAAGILGGFLGALTPIVDGITTLLDVLGPIPGIILGAFLVFRTAGTILSGAAAAVGVLVTALGGLATLAGSLGLAGLATGITGIGVALTGVASFLTGPWGFALLGAAAAVAILVGAQDDGAAAAQRHQQAVERLAGSLDQYTGEVTKATQQQITQELAMTKMADGTTTLTQALSQVGISFKDFSAAAAGNEPLLQKVNAQLSTQAQTLIKNSSAWDASAATIEKYNIPLEKVAAAALGNVQALEELTTVHGLNETSARNMVEQFREELGVLGELGPMLGERVGQLNEAEAATRQAAMAMADFGEELANTQGAMQQFGDAINKNTGELIAAAPGATQLAEAFDQLSFAALAAATEAGNTAAAMSTIGTGGAAAAASMAQSRQAFIDAAMAAGLTVEAAGRLADALGLIPEAARIIFETNATQAEAEIINLVARIQALGEVPATLVVEMLTDEAIAALDELGVKVKELPDGQMLLLLEDSEFQAKLQAAIDAGKNLPEILIELGIDMTNADGQLNEWRAKNDSFNQPITFTTKLDTAQAQADYDTFYAMAMQPLPPAPFDIDAAPAQGKYDAFKAQTAVPLVSPLDADPTLANGKLAGLLGLVNGSIGVMTIDANEAPAMAKLAATVGAVNGALGTMTIDGDNGPALAKLAAAVGVINGTTATMTIDGDAGPAIAAARAAVATINAMSATITVTTIRRTVEVGASIGSRAGVVRPSGGLVPRFAKGGIVPGYAPGLDRVPALLSPGEGILVPEAVRMLGARAIVNLNRLASGGRKSVFMSKTGADAYMSFGTAGGRTPVGGGGDGGMVKNYYLTIQNAGNSEVDLRDQFRRMEVLGL